MIFLAHDSIYPFPEKKKQNKPFYQKCIYDTDWLLVCLSLMLLGFYCMFK